MARHLQGTVVSLTTGCRPTAAESIADRSIVNQNQEGQSSPSLPPKGLHSLRTFRQ